MDKKSTEANVPGIWIHPVADGHLAISLCDGDMTVTIGLDKAAAFKYGTILLKFSQTV